MRSDQPLCFLAAKVMDRNELGEPIMATPAIADHKLYVRTAGHLWAFGKS